MSIYTGALVRLVTSFNHHRYKLIVTLTNFKEIIRQFNQRDIHSLTNKKKSKGIDT